MMGSLTRGNGVWFCHHPRFVLKVASAAVHHGGWFLVAFGGPTVVATRWLVSVLPTPPLLSAPIASAAPNTLGTSRGCFLMAGLVWATNSLQIAFPVFKFVRTLMSEALVPPAFAPGFVVYFYFSSWTRSAFFYFSIPTLSFAAFAPVMW